MADVSGVHGPARCDRALAAVIVLLSVACGSTAANSPSQPTPQTFVVSGSATNRITGSPLAQATFTLSGGVGTLSGPVNNGEFRLSGVTAGTYRLELSAPGFVTHTTSSLPVDRDVSLALSAIPWGGQSLGATYDERFSQFFHQVARVSSAATESLRRWTIPPQQLYVVADVISSSSLELVLSAVDVVNRDTVPAVFCGFAGPLAIVSGPSRSSPSDGQILIRPSESGGSSGTLGGPRSGTVTLGLSSPALNRSFTRDELAATLSHEIFHVAGAYHLCGGDTGTNPFGFSRDNCPYPTSLMANLGSLIAAPSPEDRLAACLMYHPHTVRGNLAPDTNPTYR